MKAANIAMIGLPAIAAASLSVGSAHAATLAVCPSGCAYKTIQSAIDAAHDNDTITIAKGHYFETLNTQGKALTLLGSYYRQVIVDANGQGTVITIPGVNRVTMENLTITRGFGFGGGIMSLAAPISLINSVVVSNFSTADGGGLSLGVVANEGSINITGCTISDNEAPSGAGGGIAVGGNNGVLGVVAVNIERSTIARNTASSEFEGGGVFIGGDFITATIDNSSIVDNVNVGLHAQIEQVQALNTLVVKNSTIAGNSGGGVLYGDFDATFTNVVVAHNFGASAGGGIAARRLIGGIIKSGNPTTSMSGVYVIQNSATNDGGGVYLEGSLGTVSDVVIDNNTPNNCAKSSGTVCP